MRRNAIGCPDAGLHRILTARVMSLVREATSVASGRHPVLINIGFRVQPLSLIVIAGAHRRIFVAHYFSGFLSN